MQADQREQNSGNNEYVEGEEARECGSRNDWAAQHEIYECTPYKWNTANNGRANAEAPIRVLIEAENLSCEGHAKSKQQQEYPDNPGEFAREFVGAEQKDLHQVNQHDGDHEVG